MMMMMMTTMMMLVLPGRAIDRGRVDIGDVSDQYRIDMAGKGTCLAGVGGEG